MYCTYNNWPVHSSSHSSSHLHPSIHKFNTHTCTLYNIIQTGSHKLWIIYYVFSSLSLFVQETKLSILNSHPQLICLICLICSSILSTMYVLYYGIWRRQSQDITKASTNFLVPVQVESTIQFYVHCPINPQCSLKKNMEKLLFFPFHVLYLYNIIYNT